MKALKTLFTGRRSDEASMNIGTPTQAQHLVHVVKDEQTGALRGLPDQWLKLINKALT